MLRKLAVGFACQPSSYFPDQLPRQFRGTKNPSRRFKHLNSATQTSVNSRSVYPDRAGCQRLFLFCCRRCVSATWFKLPVFSRLSKTNFNFFHRQKSSLTKNEGQTLSQPK